MHVCISFSDFSSLFLQLVKLTGIFVHLPHDRYPPRPAEAYLCWQAA
jgi:hypothetical protein